MTPEAVVLELPAAGVGPRLLCRSLDILLTVAGVSLVAIVVSAAAGGGTVALVVFNFGLFVTVLLYPVLMEGLWGGRTIGKLVLRLRVVRVDGGPIGLREAAVRGALGLIEVWSCAGSIGLLAMFISARGQRLGDMAAGTLVLREPAARSLAPMRIWAPPGCEGLVRAMDVGLMTPHDYEVVRSFLARWDNFGPRRRPVVASRVAAPLWRRFRHPLPEGLSAEHYLACLGAAYQLRHPPAARPGPGASPWVVPPRPAPVLVPGGASWSPTPGERQATEPPAGANPWAPPG